MTAWQMLFDYAQAKAGQTVLIRGAAGNVGAYAVKMAHNAGLEVFATASSKDLDYVRELGAGSVINYRQTPFEDVVRAVDIVLDTVGGDTRVRSIGVLKSGGILVSVVSSPMAEEIAANAGVRAVYFIVDVNTDRLNTIAELFGQQETRAASGYRAAAGGRSGCTSDVSRGASPTRQDCIECRGLERSCEFFGGSVKTNPKKFKPCPKSIKPWQG